MKVVVYSIKEYAKLWTYINFQEHHKADLIDYKMKGEIIEYIIYEVKELDIEYIIRQELSYECEEYNGKSV